MMGRISICMALGVSASALAGCPHSGGADTTPAGAATPSTGLPEDASTADVSTASVDASLTPVEAAAPSVEASIPTPSPPDMTSAPAYPPSALLETFSNAKAKLIACYEPGRKRNPKLRGKVIVKLTINTDGSAKPVVNQNSNLEDPEVIACVIRTVKSLRFPKPVEGSVTVTYPFIFRPTGDETLILPEAGKQ